MPKGSNARVPGNLVQETAHRRRAFSEDQDARISIMATASASLRRIRLRTTEPSRRQLTRQRGGPYVAARIPRRSRNRDCADFEVAIPRPARRID